MVESSTQTAFLTQDSLQAPGGFNYVEVYLARRGEADVVAADFYYYSSGERLSESLRRLLLDWAAREERPNRTTLEKMQAANADRLQAIMVALKVGRKKDAYAVYSTMPRELQKDRVIQMMAIAAAADVGQKEHLSILEDFRREHAGDPALDVVSLGYFLLTKNFKEATTCLDRIDKAVGGDLYLSLYRGKILAEQGHGREARIEMEKAIDACPDHHDVVWERMMVAANEKNHDETFDWLKYGVTQFEFDVDEKALRPFSGLEPFLKSARYQELLKWQKARGK